MGSVSCLVLQVAFREGLIQWFSIVFKSIAPKLFLTAQQTLESLSNSLAPASYFFSGSVEPYSSPQLSGAQTESHDCSRKPNPNPASLM